MNDNVKNDIKKLIKDGEIDKAFDIITASAYFEGKFGATISVEDYRELFKIIKDTIRTKEQPQKIDTRKAM